MKPYLIIVATLYVLVCTVSSFRSQPGEIAPQLSLGKVADLTRHLKRQTTPSTQDLLDCGIAAVDYQCGSSGYLQGIVDIALGCGNDSLARNVANGCSISEGGGFCVTEFIRLTSDESLAAGAASCSAAASSGSCPSSCSSFLESVSSRLGCCINTYVNTTESGLLEFYGEFVDYGLWRLCNVPLPASDCGNGLPLNPPQDAQQCTFQQLVTRVANYECMPSVGQPLINTLQQNSRCSDIAKQYVDECSVNDNNEFCFEVIGSDIFSDVSSNSLYFSLVANCSTSSSAFCSSSCQSAINDINDSYGCCVSVFNDTAFGAPELSYGVWNRCGVQTPGVCTDSTLTLSGAATVQGFAWMIAVAMALYMALCI